MGAESKVNTIVLKWSILNLLSAISAEITFDRDESATLVPYSLTTHKIVTVLPVSDNLTNVVMEEARNASGVKLKRLSQKRLDDEIRSRLNKEARNATKTLKIIKANFTPPTLQKLVNVAARRKFNNRHRKKHHSKGSVLSFPDNTKEFSWSGENESESRSYNYDPTYPVYNYASPTTDSGEDSFMSNLKDMWNGYPDHESQTPTFPSLTTTYAPKIVQNPVPVNNDYSFGDWRPPTMNPPRFRRPLGIDEPPIYVDYIDDTRVINLDHLGRYWHAHGHSPILIRTGYHRFQDEDSIEYQPYRDHESEHHGWDYSKLAVLLLTKIGLFKMKVFVLLKLGLLFLIKMKLLLMALFLKVLILIKAAKLLKLIFVPLLLAALVPLIGMILIPLLGLIPMLLSMIRVPVFVPDEQEMPMPETKTDDIDNAESSRAPLTPATLLHFKMILSSEQCLKRLVCELAAQGKPSLKSLLISRLLDAISEVVPLRKVKTYVDVYKSGIHFHQNQTESWCSTQYECSHFKNRTVSL